MILVKNTAMPLRIIFARSAINKVKTITGNPLAMYITTTLKKSSHEEELRLNIMPTNNEKTRTSANIAKINIKTELIFAA